MKLDALGIGKSTAEMDIGGNKVGFARVKVEALLHADFEYSLERGEKAVSVRRIVKHIVKPDEQIEVREKRFHG